MRRNILRGVRTISGCVLFSVLLSGCAPALVCINARTHRQIPDYYCNPAATPFHESPSLAPPPLRGPLVGLDPLVSPGLTVQPFLGPGGGMVCSTVDYGYGEALTICQ